MSVEKREWQELCEAASKEHDSKKLITLVSQLLRALDGQSFTERFREPQG